MTKVTHLTLDEQGALSRKRIHLREISGESDAPLETVGQDLRAARLRRGDDLATVSRALKIRKDHLEALEEDRFESLPGRAYAVGFVRSYADYLGLDPLLCVERFKSEIAGRNEDQPTVGPPPDTEGLRLPQGWVVIGIVVLLLVVYVAYHLARSADTLLHQQVAPVPARIAPPPAPTVNSVTVPHKAAPTPPPAAAKPETPANSDVSNGAQGADGQDTQSPAATNAAAANTAPPVPVPAPTAAPENSPPQPLPNGHVYGGQNHNPRVVLRARVATQILVEDGHGGVVLNQMLQPGDSFNLPNKVGLTLTTPNGSAIAVELDGQPMGYAGQGARMTEALSLDPQAIVDRYNRGFSR